MSFDKERYAEGEHPCSAKTPVVQRGVTSLPPSHPPDCLILFPCGGESEHEQLDRKNASQSCHFWQCDDLLWSPNYSALPTTSWKVSVIFLCFTFIMMLNTQWVRNRARVIWLGRWTIICKWKWFTSAHKNLHVYFTSNWWQLKNGWLPGS